MTQLNNFFFIIFPYVAVFVLFIGGFYRFFRKGYTVSSLSSQFLEGKKLFWGSVPFHFGLMVVFFGHLVAFLFPKSILLWNQIPIRLFILECTALVFSFSLIYGLIRLFIRRTTNDRILVVTNKMDIVLELLLILQCVSGVYIAMGHRWGSSWFATVLSPYLWSIVKFNPQIEAVSAMPMVVKLHIIGAFLILLVIPFSRLIHMFAMPLHYIFRPMQRVIWNWNPKEVRDSKTKWNWHRPKNN